MSVTEMDTDISTEVGQLLAAWLRRCYPDAKAKRLALDFGVVEATAKKWLAGHLPDTPTMIRMLARWGAPFAADVLAPTGHFARLAALECELEQIGESIAATQRLLETTKHEMAARSLASVPGRTTPRVGKVAR